MQHTIAIDLGGTIIKIGLLNSGQLIDRREIKARSATGLQPQLPELEIAINGMLKSNKIQREDVSGIGFSFAGLVDSSRNRILSTNQKYEVQLKKAKFPESAALYGADYLVRTSLSPK